MAKDQDDKRAARLAALRDRMKNQDFSGGGAGFWSPKQGVNTIRILPEVGDMEFFFQPVGRHYFPPNGKESCYCPKFTSEGELECPVCDLVDDLYKEGQKELAKELRVRKSWWMNVIDRKDPKAGPQIFTPGQTIFGYLASMVGDPDYGDITDIEEGLDIVIEREGEKLDTEYQVRAKRQETPLADDDETIEDWLDKAKDLSMVELTEDENEDKDLIEGHAVYVMPYDRIVRQFKLETADFEAAEETASEPPKSKRAGRDVKDDDDGRQRTRPRSRR